MATQSIPESKDAAAPTAQAELIEALATAGFKKDDGSRARAMIEAAPEGFDFSASMAAAAANPRQRHRELAMMAERGGMESPVAKEALLKGILSCLATGEEEGYESLMSAGGFPALPPAALDRVVAASDQRLVLAVLPFVDDSAPGAAKSIVGAIDRFGLDEGDKGERARFAHEQASLYSHPRLRAEMLNYDAAAWKKAVVDGELAGVGDKLSKRREQEAQAPLAWSIAPLGPR